MVIKNSSSNKALDKLFEAEKKLNKYRKKAAILFADMVGSTKYKDNKGIDAGLKHTVYHNLLIKNTVEKFCEKALAQGSIDDGKICKYIGDEVMVYLTGKHAQDTAIGLAVDIQNTIKKFNAVIDDDDERFHSKIGVDYGNVHFYTYDSSMLDPQGLAVDRAARIIGIAKPDQILISDDIAKSCRSSQLFGPKSIREFKGIKGNNVIYEVKWNKKQLGVNPTKTELNISQLLKIHSSQKIYHFDQKGNATITWKATIENTGDNTLPRFKVPFQFDICDEKLRTSFEIKKIRVNNQELSNPSQYYEYDGKMVSKKGPQKVIGAVIIPFVGLSGLKKNQCVSFEITSKINGAFTNIMTTQGDSTAHDINHVTANFQLILFPPKNKKLTLVQDGNHPNGFAVYDNKADLIDTKIMSCTDDPKLLKSSIVWVMKNPYLNSRYVLHFRVL